MSLVIELVMRAWFAFIIGPSVLLYGISPQRKHIESEHMSSWNGLKEAMPAEERLERNVGVHDDDYGAYTKYYPNQKRVDIDVETGKDSRSG